MVTNVNMSLVFLQILFQFFFHTMTYLTEKLIEFVADKEVFKAGSLNQVSLSRIKMWVNALQYSIEPLHWLITWFCTPLVIKEATSNIKRFKCPQRKQLENLTLKPWMLNNISINYKRWFGYSYFPFFPTSISLVNLLNRFLFNKWHLRYLMTQKSASLTLEAFSSPLLTCVQDTHWRQWMTL